MSKLKAITSSIVEHKLGVELKKEDLSVYLLYRIIIETGVPYKVLISPPVEFFRDKYCITYSLKNKEKNTGYFSQDTLENIKIYTANKKDSDYMFPGRFKNVPMDNTTANRLLKRCSARIGRMEPITTNVLKKTYLYHQYLLMDEHSFKKKFSISTEKGICELLGLETLPSKITYWDKCQFSDFLNKTDFAKIVEDLNTVISCSHQINEQKQLPEIYFKETIEAITTTQTALSKLLTFYKDTGFLKDNS